MAHNKPDIFRPTSIVQAMLDRNELPQALLSGVYGIRRSVTNTKGERTPSIADFIPKERNETAETYSNRLLRTYITPYFENAISSATGQIFANPLIINTGDNAPLPEEIQTLLDKNIDLDGTGFNEQMIGATSLSFAYGMAIAFVDYMNPSDSDNLAEQQAAGARPFVRIISPNDLLGYSTDNNGNLTMIRFLEEANIEDHDLGLATTKRVRVVRPTEWAVYEDDSDGPVDAGDVVRFDSSGNRIVDKIPVAVMYGRKLGTMNAASVFEAMAYINLHHTQVNSDLSWSSHFYLTPFLFVLLGDAVDPPDNGESIVPTLASYVNVTLPEGSDIKWIETNGKAQESASKYLKDVEDRIQISTMSTNIGATGSKETATGRAIDAQTTTAKLKLHAEAVENFAQQIIEIIASYMRGVDLPEFNVIANKEFSINSDMGIVKILKDMVNEGILTNETLLAEIKRRGILSDDVDIAIELERILEESAKDGIV